MVLEMFKKRSADFHSENKSQTIKKEFINLSSKDLSDDTFNNFKKLIYITSGICLADKKRALLMSRLGKRMRQLQIASFTDYFKYVENDKSGTELISLIDAISTNVTEFYRESNHFGILSQHISEWKNAGQRKFRLWSAACSSGEEPLTMIMLCNELVSRPEIDFKILATDISTKILDKARNAVFEDIKTKKIPSELKDKYFDKTFENNAFFWKLKSRYRKFISFNRLNLSMPPFPMKGPFDIIFCRNVMIYFDNIVRQALIDDIWRLLKPGGLFLIGQAESLNALKTNFKMIKPSLYKKMIN
jgi:chemotaxis protein methyltransferase CheR